jgi:hypothetical protein
LPSKIYERRPKIIKKGSFKSKEKRESPPAKQTPEKRGKPFTIPKPVKKRVMPAPTPPVPPKKPEKKS